MKRRALFLVGLVAWCALFCVSYAQGPQLAATAKLNKKSIVIGEPFQYSITVTSQPKTAIVFPSFAETFGESRVLHQTIKKWLWFGIQKTRLILDLSVFNTGKLTIPALTITAKDLPGNTHSLQVAAQEITVQSLMGNTQVTPPLRALREAREFSSARAWMIVGIIVLVCALLGYLIFFAPIGSRAKKAPPPSAHEIAFAQLEELKQKNLIAAGKVEEFYVTLSDTLRHYLEGRFHVRAPEMTTEEFLLYVRDSAILQQEYQSILKEFLTSCDLVKFAQYAPDQAQIERSFETVVRFVDQTKLIITEKPHAIQ